MRTLAMFAAIYLLASFSTTAGENRTLVKPNNEYKLDGETVLTPKQLNYKILASHFKAQGLQVKQLDDGGILVQTDNDLGFTTGVAIGDKLLLSSTVAPIKDGMSSNKVKLVIDEFNKKTKDHQAKIHEEDGVRIIIIQNNPLTPKDKGIKVTVLDKIVDTWILQGTLNVAIINAIGAEKGIGDILDTKEPKIKKKE